MTAVLDSLSRLLWRGGVSVGIAALTAVCIAWILSFAAKHSEPKQKQEVVATTSKPGRAPNHCRSKR
jgi:hypothetical protein